MLTGAIYYILKVDLIQSVEFMVAHAVCNPALWASMCAFKVGIVRLNAHSRQPKCPTPGSFFGGMGDPDSISQGVFRLCLGVASARHCGVVYSIKRIVHMTNYTFTQPFMAVIPLSTWTFFSGVHLSDLPGSWHASRLD